MDELAIPVLYAAVYDFIEEAILPPLGWPEFDTILKAYRAERAPTVHAYVDTLPALTCAAAGGVASGAIPLTAAWVFYILASKVFDDWQDGDGRELVWAEGGLQAGLSIGLYALGAAKSALAHLEADAGTLRAIVEALGNTMALAAKAQSEHLALEALTVEKYFKNLAAKTGLIFATGAWAGARLATARPDPQVLVALYQYGLNTGIAGQIADDCLDLAQGDLANDVLTLPVIYALSQTQRPEHFRLAALLEGRADGSDGWVTAVNGILEAMGAIEWSLQVAKVYAGRALAALEALPQERVSLLVEYVTRTPNVAL